MPLLGGGGEDAASLPDSRLSLPAEECETRLFYSSRDGLSPRSRCRRGDGGGKPQLGSRRCSLELPWGLCNT